MANRRRIRSVDWLTEQIDEQLTQLRRNSDNLNLREKVLLLAELNDSVKDLGLTIVSKHGLSSRAAIERIRLYLIEYVGVIIDGAELAVVSGISDYPRRIRELRVEKGYQISSGAGPDANSGVILKPDQYLLVSDIPDVDAARRWHVANRIRRNTHGSKNKLLEFLLENVGIVVTTEELAYVANNAREFARRIRELRTEEGYSIATRFTGRPDLNVGQYVMQSAERITEPHDRKIPENIQQQVYQRDENTCRLCGWDHDRWSRKDPRILELHHIEEHAKGGKNIAKNLVVLCSKCHDEVHKGMHTEHLSKIRKSL